MNPLYFNIASVLAAATSAAYWARSARVDFPFGFSMDEELRAAMKKASSFNAKGAAFAAVAAACQAASVFIDTYCKVNVCG